MAKPKPSKYPLEMMFEEFADSRRIKLVRMTLKQLAESGIPLDESFRYELNLTSEDQDPFVLIGRNIELSLSYLGYMVGLVGREEDKLDYHPKGVLVAEGKYRTLELHAETGSYMGHRVADLNCQLVDKMFIKLLPRAFRKNTDNHHLGIYDASFKLNHKNLAHVERLLHELF